MSSLTSAPRGPAATSAGGVPNYLSSTLSTVSSCASMSPISHVSTHTPLSPRALQALLEGDDEAFEDAVVAMDVPSLLELVHALQNSIAVEQR